MAGLLDILGGSGGGSDAATTPQSGGGLLGLLGGGKQDPQAQLQMVMRLLAAPQQPHFGGAPMPQGGGSAPSPMQPFAPPIPNNPVPNFAALAQLRQKLGLPPMAPQQQDPMTAQLALASPGGIV